MKQSLVIIIFTNDKNSQRIGKTSMLETTKEEREQKEQKHKYSREEKNPEVTRNKAVFYESINLPSQKGGPQILLGQKNLQPWFASKTNHHNLLRF